MSKGKSQRDSAVSGQADTTPGSWGNGCLGTEWGCEQHTTHLLRTQKQHSEFYLDHVHVLFGFTYNPNYM